MKYSAWNDDLNIMVYETMCALKSEMSKQTQNCRGCIYHSEHSDMGATIDVCILEKDLGKAVAACENSEKCENKLTLADVNKLKAERDAAVADLKEISYCCNCIQCSERDGNEIWCTSFGDWFEWYDTCEEWKWRGVPHE